MRVLFTSDWQCEWETIPLCEQAVQEIRDLKKKLGFEVLVHCGDTKHVYNPIDARVAIFWQRAISDFRKDGLDVHIDLGNHDRLGMHVDKQNWFPILRKSGAKCYDDPGYADLDRSCSIAFQPFRSNPVVLRRELHDLARGSDGSSAVLVFHGDVQQARYNVLSSSASTSGISIKDLCPEKYLFCVGGHIHLQQKLSRNVWYVGSPFATDWGEANQRKGYLLFDSKEKSLEQVASQIPGWYDPQWPGFYEPKTWKGTRVRVKVEVQDTKQYHAEIEKAREEATRKYPQAEIVLNVSFDKAGGSERTGIRLGDSDRRKLEIYTSNHLPENLERYRERINNYLVNQLKQVGGLQRSGGKLDFHSIAAQNCLSFRELKIKFEPGVCVVQGVNKDRRGKSNGSGKTSFLQPLAIALFNTTFKGQKHDHWVNRWAKPKEDAFVRTRSTLSDGRKLSVFRGRRPKVFELKVDGVPHESGNRPEDTQKLLEGLIGYTWETFSNAVYIDQTRAHLMLSGTEGERKTFLAKLQNLERFERALKRVKAEKGDLDARLFTLNERITTAQTAVSSLERTISLSKDILANGPALVVSLAAREIALKEAQRIESEWEAKAEKKLASFEKQKKEIEEERVKLAVEFQIVSNKIKKNKEEIEELEKFEGGQCPTCEQDVNEKQIGFVIEGLKNENILSGNDIARIKPLLEDIRRRFNAVEEESHRWLRNRELSRTVADLRESVAGLKVRVETFQKHKVMVDGFGKKRDGLEAKLKDLQKTKNKIVAWYKVVEYAERVFARDGLPAYLNAQVVPALNVAAGKYSEIFTQGEIQVRFAVDADGELDVQILNLTGGEGVDDQSEGEMKIASLITSFAIREAAPKTNLLILDEPGHGLDSLSAKQFARGLQKIAGEFDTILVTSHNEHILSALATERTITVVKENRISRVVTDDGEG